MAFIAIESSRASVASHCIHTNPMIQWWTCNSLHWIWVFSFPLPCLLSLPSSSTSLPCSFFSVPSCLTFTTCRLLFLFRCLLVYKESESGESFSVNDALAGYKVNTSLVIDVRQGQRIRGPFLTHLSFHVLITCNRDLVDMTFSSRGDTLQSFPSSKLPKLASSLTCFIFIFISFFLFLCASPCSTSSCSSV